jgi:flagellar motility protein MotE (MotC chaperone)
MKKKNIFILTVVLVVSLLVVIYLFSVNNVKAEAEKFDRSTIDKLLKELRREQALVEQEKQKLEQVRQNLESFKTELDKRYTRYLKDKKQLEENEADFNSRVELRMVDRQTIETYENIDPEQAAILLQNLYQKDNTLATLIMRKISGKKAGRILEAMIPIDKEVSTKIAKEALDYYRPK